MFRGVAEKERTRSPSDQEPKAHLLCQGKVQGIVKEKGYFFWGDPKRLLQVLRGGSFVGDLEVHRIKMLPFGQFNSGFIVFTGDDAYEGLLMFMCEPESETQQIGGHGIRFGK